MKSLLRSAVLVLAAVVGLTLVPVAAANATGPGSMTLTVTSDQPLSFFAFAFVEGPGGGQFAGLNGGTATLSDLALGDYIARVGADSSSPGGSIAFTLSAGAPDFVGELHLSAWPAGTGSLSGAIIDDSGNPVSGASVHLYSGERPFPGVTSGPDGSYAFADLPAGDYNVGGYASGYFPRDAQLTIADGEAATFDLVLPEASSSVSGRLVDGSGNPVADVSVSGTRTNGFDSRGTQSGPDGTFSIAGLGAGDWNIVAGGPGSPWAATQLGVTLANGEAAAVGDIVLAPRTTALVYGWTEDESTVPYPTSVVDICATLLLPNGSVVATFDPTGVDGTFVFFEVAPGDYTVRLVDCDPTRVPPYATQYNGGGSTLANAVIFTVTAGQDVSLGQFSMVRSTTPPEPTGNAIAVPNSGLKKSNQGDIGAPSSVTQGAQLTIVAGQQFAGQWVSVWLQNGDVQLGGWHLVAPDGTITVTATVPVHYSQGQHKLVVQDSTDHVIGWTTIRVQRG